MYSFMQSIVVIVMYVEKIETKIFIFLKVVGIYKKLIKKL